MDQVRSGIIQEYPIGNGLDSCRMFFQSFWAKYGCSNTEDALNQLSQNDLRLVSMVLFALLEALPASGYLPSRTGRSSLRDDLSRFTFSENFDFGHIKPLLKEVFADVPSDALVWDQVYKAVTESTPPHQPAASSSQQMSWFYSTDSLMNSSEYHQAIDRELGNIYVGLPQFPEIFFGRVVGLDAAAREVFKRCTEGNDPPFHRGWRGWPEDTNQDAVLAWFADTSEKLTAFAEPYKPRLLRRRRLWVQPDKPIGGSTSEHKLDIGFVSDPNGLNDINVARDPRRYWSQILIPGELSGNPSADISSKTWLDLGRYAREVLATQDNRRFILAFTICGSIMRIWEYDRLGGVASDQFDVNKDGLRFVSTILAFLWMDEEDLGFDLTIITENDRRYIDIERNSRIERLVIDKLIRRPRCISGRATTCWKAHREGDPARVPLVIKDSWQDVERDEEGELLRNATNREVINVARYYHHQTINIRGQVDDVQHNIRGEINTTEAKNDQPRHSTCRPPSNRVHRRVIVCDYGKPIYEASSPAALIAALEGCIKGHESLHKAGLLHRDISVNNLMINEDPNNPSWPSFLIDLDLAVRQQRDGASGAHGKTGTRAFMAIGALLGHQHSFMHDLESFFWVLFWICVHFDGPGRDIGSTAFESWNYENDNRLIGMKKAEIDDEEDFLINASGYFTPYYKPLVPWVNKLRRVVFPDGKRWKKENTGLYTQMRNILREAQDDMNARMTAQ